MNEQELQKIQDWLAKELGLHKVPADVWAELTEEYENLLTHAVVGGDEEKEDLLRYTRPLYKAWRRGREGRKAVQERVQQKDFIPPLDSLADERALAFEEYMAKRAVTDPKVY